MSKVNKKKELGKYSSAFLDIWSFQIYRVNMIPNSWGLLCNRLLCTCLEAVLRSCHQSMNPGPGVWSIISIWAGGIPQPQMPSVGGSVVAAYRTAKSIHLVSQVMCWWSPSSCTSVLSALTLPNRRASLSVTSAHTRVSGPTPVRPVARGSLDRSTCGAMP